MKHCLLTQILNTRKSVYYVLIAVLQKVHPTLLCSISAMTKSRVKPIQNFLIKQGRNKRAGCEKKIGFVIEQAKNFASRVAKYLKIVPEHAGLLGTREYHC